MIDGPGAVRFHERALAGPGPGEVLIQPRWSSFKHGTEMMAYSGRSPFAKRRFDPQLRLFEDRPAGEAFYPRPMGSMVVGVVERIGADVSGFAPGDAGLCLGAGCRPACARGTAASPRSEG